MVLGLGFRVWGLGFDGFGSTWTPKLCRIIAFGRCWNIILATFGGAGRV